MTTTTRPVDTAAANPIGKCCGDDAPLWVEGEGGGRKSGSLRRKKAIRLLFTEAAATLHRNQPTPRSEKDHIELATAEYSRVARYPMNLLLWIY
jgi:hypothetical protein